MSSSTQQVTKNSLHGMAVFSNYTESPGILGSDGLRVSQVTYVKTYMHELLRGVGEVQLTYSYLRDGQIDFSGFELFSGGVGDKKGSLILTVAGSVSPENGVVSAKQLLSYGAGSAELYGYSGEVSYVIKDKQCSFELTLLT